MHKQREPFEYTISSVIIKDIGFMFKDVYTPDARDVSLKMIFHDIATNPAMTCIQLLLDTKKILTKRQTTFLGKQKANLMLLKQEKTPSRGIRLHQG